MKKLTLRRLCSIEQLTAIKDVTPELARQVREAWATIPSRQEAREAVDDLIGTFGVEYLGTHRRSGEHFFYCNAGDTYSTTVLFSGPRMYVGCWGDLVERNLIRSPEQI